MADIKNVECWMSRKTLQIIYKKQQKILLYKKKVFKNLYFV